MSAATVTTGFFGDKSELGPEWVPLAKFDHAGRDRNGGHSEEYKALAHAIREGTISARQKFVGIGRSGGRIYVVESEAVDYLLRRALESQPRDEERPAIVKAEAQRDLFECKADAAALAEISGAVATLARELRAMRAEVAKLTENLGPTFETFDAVRDGWVGKDGRP